MSDQVLTSGEISGDLPGDDVLPATRRTQGSLAVADGDLHRDSVRARPRRSRPESAYNRLVKPLGDRVVALLAILLLSPLLIAVAIAVRVSLGKPVLYRQTRVGAGGQKFTIFKFRSMKPDLRHASPGREGDERRISHKRADDPRHTRFGRLLRRTSLDELPQLFNVLRGEMSLVGPRPELVSIVATYDDWQHRRHAVKPGITGWWQVNGRGHGLMHEHTEMDLVYVENVSLLMDLRVLLLTVPALFRRNSG